MIYTYTSTSGKSVERNYHHTKFPRRIRIDGEWYHKDIAATHTENHAFASAAWPMESEACGVNPAQINEAKDLNAKLGVRAEYNPETGAVRWDSPGHRKKWCEAHGYYDRNGAYSSARRLSDEERCSRFGE